MGTGRESVCAEGMGMRLLEFVPCGRRAFLPEPEDPAATLAPLPGAVKTEKRRWRSSTAPAAAWRPSLGAISEDGSALAAKVRTSDRRAAPGKPRPRTTKRASVAARHRSDGDDLRLATLPILIQLSLMFIINVWLDIIGVNH